MGKRDARQVAKEVTFRKWANIVIACQSSGLNTVDWCKENGVVPSTYYKWQHRVRAVVLEAEEKNGTPLAQPPLAMLPPPQLNEIQPGTFGEKYLASRMEAVAAWKESNLSAAEWCRQQGIPKSTFHQWKVQAQELEERGMLPEQYRSSSQALQPRFTELPALPAAVAEEPSAPEPAAGEPAIRVQIGGAVVEIQKEADARLAESVVRALAGQC